MSNDQKVTQNEPRLFHGKPWTQHKPDNPFILNTIWACSISEQWVAIVNESSCPTIATNGTSSYNVLIYHGTSRARLDRVFDGTLDQAFEFAEKAWVDWVMEQYTILQNLVNKCEPNDENTIKSNKLDLLKHAQSTPQYLAYTAYK
jgi:hypothetical protein